MPSERGPFAKLAVKGGAIALAGALGLAAALFGSARRGAPDPLDPAAAESLPSVAATTSPEGRAAPPPAATPGSARPDLPPEILEAIENGPKDPLTPPVIHVDAEPAPGSVVTAAPLVPSVISVDAEPAPGSIPTAAPLVPPAAAPAAAP